MTGPEHYAIAESLIGSQTVKHGGKHFVRESPDDAVIGIAQVHATLALAAATAIGVPDLETDDHIDAWLAAVWPS